MGVMTLRTKMGDLNTREVHEDPDARRFGTHLDLMFEGTDKLTPLTVSASHIIANNPERVYHTQINHQLEFSVCPDDLKINLCFIVDGYFSRLVVVLDDISPILNCDRS